MKPRKSWEPEYRFGGNKASFLKPPLLGTTATWRPVINNPRGSKHKGKRK